MWKKTCVDKTYKIKQETLKLNPPHKLWHAECSQQAAPRQCTEGSILSAVTAMIHETTLTPSSTHHKHNEGLILGTCLWKLCFQKQLKVAKKMTAQTKQKKNYRSVAPSCFRKWKFGNKDNTVTHGNFRLPFTWQHFKEKKKRNCFGRYFCSQHPLFDDITQVLKDDGLRLAGTSVESVTSLGWVTPRADDEEYRVFQFPETMQPSISLLAFSAKLCLHIHTWKNTTDPS